MSVRESYQKHKGLSWLIGIAVIAALVAVYVVKAQTPTVRYITMPVRRGSITAVVQSTGTINPLTTVPVGSFVSGTVQYIFADFNTQVHAGDVLAQLDPTIYDAQVTTAMPSPTFKTSKPASLPTRLMWPSSKRTRNTRK